MHVFFAPTDLPLSLPAMGLANLKVNLSSRAAFAPSLITSSSPSPVSTAYTPLGAFLLTQLITFTKLFLLICIIRVVWRRFANWVRGHLVRRLTAMEDLDSLERSRKDDEKLSGTAVIAGGSIAGLLTARVCANHFEKVVVVEPEEWTFSTSSPSNAIDNEDKTSSQPNRSRVPQYTALHGYQAFSYLVLSRMFPNFDSHALELSPSAVGPCDYNIYYGGRLLRAPLEAYGGTNLLPKFVGLTRPAFECLIRRLMKAVCGNSVEFVAGSVSGVLVNPDEVVDGKQRTKMGRITGAILRNRKGEEVVRNATFLVDCTGPTCAGIKWLSHPHASDSTASVSAQQPQGQPQDHQSQLTPIHIRKQVYDPKMRYTTVTYHVDRKVMEKLDTLPCDGGWAKASALYTYLPDARMDRRTLLVMKREGELLQFACGGFDLADRPRSVDDVRTFVSSLNGLDSVPDFLYDILNAVQDMEDAGWELDARYSDVRIPPCYKVHYEDVQDRLPANFVAIGDSISRVNPVRGQGCTKAAVGVATLSGLLDKLSFGSTSSEPRILPSTFADSFWSRQAARVGGLWDQTKAEDYGWETTSPVEGETLEDGKLTRWYTRNLIAVGREDPMVANVIYGSAMFLAPGTDALHPAVVARVIWAGFKEYLGWTKLGVEAHS